LIYYHLLQITINWIVKSNEKFLFPAELFVIFCTALPALRRTGAGLGANGTLAVEVWMGAQWGLKKRPVMFEKKRREF
jgi:hypothetical protein